MRIGVGIDPRAAAEEQVPVLTIDDLLVQEGVDPATPIDLIKCDIEGAERELFECGGPWLSRTRVMVVELHSPYGREEFLAHVRRACGGEIEIYVEPVR